MANTEYQPMGPHDLTLASGAHPSSLDVPRTAHGRKPALSLRNIGWFLGMYIVSLLSLAAMMNGLRWLLAFL
jgi:fatty acid desaturase